VIRQTTTDVIHRNAAKEGLKVGNGPAKVKAPGRVAMEE
jgi:hypothetical protein